jgi:hypothetical protein
VDVISQSSSENLPSSASVPAPMSFSQSSSDYPLQHHHPQIQSSALGSAIDDSNNNANTTWAYGEGNYCICGEGYIGRMLACDMEGCDIEWFHFKCVGINKQVRVSYFVNSICFYILHSLTDFGTVLVVLAKPPLPAMERTTTF